MFNTEAGHRGALRLCASPASPPAKPAPTSLDWLGGGGTARLGRGSGESPEVWGWERSGDAFTGKSRESGIERFQAPERCT